MMKSVGRLWWERVSRCDPSSSLVFRGIGQEEGYPWRTGPGYVFRLPKSPHGIAVGIWTESAPVEHDEDGVRLSFRRLDGEERDHALEAK